MNGFERFEGDDIPAWLLEAFDAQTSLPKGPLDQFPVPLEGEIVGGKALVPKCGTPARYAVTVACNAAMADALRFYSEYLPLAGYGIVGEGSLRTRRNWLGRVATPPVEVLLITREPFVGTLVISPTNDLTGTLVEASVAHPNHPDAHGTVDFHDPRSHPDIQWRSLKEA